MTAPGKWGDPIVPKHGWECIDVEDRGPDPNDFVVCEMCEVQGIRYVHHMAHAGYSEVLGCGRICAGRMEGDEQAAQRREERFKNLAARRVEFPKRQGWRGTSKGFRLNVNGFTILIFPKEHAWRGKLVDRHCEREMWSKRGYETPEDAARAAFDGMIWAEQHWRRPR